MCVRRVFFFLQYNIHANAIFFSHLKMELHPKPEWVLNYSSRIERSKNIRSITVSFFGWKRQAGGFHHWNWFILWLLVHKTIAIKFFFFKKCQGFFKSIKVLIQGQTAQASNCFPLFLFIYVFWMILWWNFSLQ